MIYTLDAIDTFLFRSSAPFDAGTNTSAKTVFPPFPSLYSGIAYKHGRLSHGAEDLNLIRNTKIGINGLMYNNQLLAPKPADLFMMENESKAEQDEVLLCKLAEAPLSNYPLPFILLNDIPDKEYNHKKYRGNYYIPLAEINNYMKGEKITNYYNENRLYQFEEHIGITIDAATRQTEQGKFYKKQMVRTNASLYFELNDRVTIPDQTFVKAGRQGKQSYIGTTNLKLTFEDYENHRTEHGNIDIADTYFKIYLATPAIFENGWYPKWIKQRGRSSYVGGFSYKKRKINVELIAARVGKLVEVGGFRQGNNFGPKEMRYAVPAGSVLYFKIIEGSFHDAIYLFNQRCISEYRDQLGFNYGEYTYRNRVRYCDRGFGYSLVGRLSEEQINFLEGYYGSKSR